MKRISTVTAIRQHNRVKEVRGNSSKSLETTRVEDWLHLEAERSMGQATLTALGGRKWQWATLNVILKRVIQRRKGEKQQASSRFFMLSYCYSYHSKFTRTTPSTLVTEINTAVLRH